MPWSNHWCCSHLPGSLQEKRSLLQMQTNWVTRKLLTEFIYTHVPGLPVSEDLVWRRMVLNGLCSLLSGFSWMILLGGSLLSNIKTFYRFFLKFRSLSTWRSLSPWTQRPSLSKLRMFGFLNTLFISRIDGQMKGIFPAWILAPTYCFSDSWPHLSHICFKMQFPN